MCFLWMSNGACPCATKLSSDIFSEYMNFKQSAYDAVGTYFLKDNFYQSNL